MMGLRPLLDLSEDFFLPLKNKKAENSSGQKRLKGSLNSTTPMPSRTVSNFLLKHQGQCLMLLLRVHSAQLQIA